MKTPVYFTVLSILFLAETSLAEWVSCKSRAPHQNEFIHELALCDDGVQFEASPRIGSGVKIGANSQFGRDLIIGPNTQMGTQIWAGHYVHIGHSACVEDKTQFHGVNTVPDRAKAFSDVNGRLRIVPGRNGFVYKLQEGKCIEEAVPNESSTAIPVTSGSKRRRNRGKTTITPIANASVRRAAPENKSTSAVQPSVSSAQKPQTRPEPAAVIEQTQLPYGQCTEIYHPQKFVLGTVKCQPNAQFYGPSYIHQAAELYLQYKAKFNGGRVMHSAVVTIGSESSVDGSDFLGRVTIGAGNTLSSGVRIDNANTGNGVTIGVDTLIYGNLGDNIKIGVLSYVMRGATVESDTTIGHLSFLGERATLKQTFSIGDKCCIAAGIEVIGPVPSSTIVNVWGAFETVPTEKFANYVAGRCVVSDIPPPYDRS